MRRIGIGLARSIASTLSPSGGSSGVEGLSISSLPNDGAVLALFNGAFFLLLVTESGSLPGEKLSRPSSSLWVRQKPPRSRSGVGELGRGGSIGLAGEDESRLITSLIRCCATGFRGDGEKKSFIDVWLIAGLARSSEGLLRRCGVRCEAGCLGFANCLKMPSVSGIVFEALGVSSSSVSKVCASKSLALSCVDLGGNCVAGILNPGASFSTTFLDFFGTILAPVLTALSGSRPCDELNSCTEACDDFVMVPNASIGI